MKKEAVMSELYSLQKLTERNIRLFLKDKMTVFFALLAPLIALLLYFAFLRNIQLSGIKNLFSQGVDADEALISGFIDMWLVSSVLAVSCMTVALNSMLVMVADKRDGKFKDFLVSPIKPYIITLSYFFAFFIVTVVIVLIIFALSCIYLAATGSFHLSFNDFIEFLGIIILSCFSSVLILTVIMGLFRSSSASGGFSGIFSSMIGFFTGAYIPINQFDTSLQYIANVLPGSHSAALLRNVLMRGVLDKLTKDMPDIVRETMAGEYSFSLNFFGKNIGTDAMYIYLAASVVVFFVVNLLVERYKKKKMFM
ncbi:MAG: ABC transporter permease [Clostridiales bacterium]|jgi:multidrug/hemolysin transport system permease protein|nr:ABC transporter permease [Clostridiales bacterium]